MAVDAGPHATPDQIRAAEKRAEAARVAVEGDEASESESRSSAPEGRHTADASTAAPE